MSQFKEIVVSLSDILRDDAKTEALLKLRGYHAQCLIDFLDYFLSDPELRSTIDPQQLHVSVTVLGRLCGVSGLHPTSFVLSGIRDVSLKSEGHLNIYQGRYNRQHLRIRVIRVYDMEEQHPDIKGFCRETIFWNQLNHPNLVPFYGVFDLNRKERMCFVSPWMKNGDIGEYLRYAPEAPRMPFIHDIINGLQYLHTMNIIHGNLTSRKVLIDENLNAYLADCGIPTVLAEHHIPRYRWSSPEILEDYAPLTRESDVWACGCVWYEVMTGEIPFAGSSDLQVIRKLLTGKPPAQLEDAKLHPDEDLDTKLCDLLGKCWSIKPEERPGCSELLREIGNIPAAHRDPSHVATPKGHSRPGFQLRAPGSSFSNNLNRGKKILDDLYHGIEVAPSESDALHSGSSEVGSTTKD